MRLLACAGVLSVCAAQYVSAQATEPGWQRPGLNLFGVPGLLDMPSAHAMRDGDASFTVSGLDQTQRNTFHFQITPRLSGAFRYAYINDFVGRGNFYDRSFDLRYVLAEETRRRPAITIGLQDFGGTGVYSGEYVVAAKTFGRLRATGGIGWGRFGSSNGFDNPLGVISNRFDNRPGQVTGGQTGRLDADHWFRGNAAFFGGLEYLATNRLLLTAEYSSDSYESEARRIGFDRRSPINFGATYRLKNGLDLAGGYLYGNTLAVKLSYTLNPTNRTVRTGGRETAPIPVRGRAPESLDELGWVVQPGAQDVVKNNVEASFKETGLELESLALTARTATLKFRNTQFISSAQAVGRAARLLTVLAPPSVETFVLIPVTASGLAASRVTIKRSDMEDLEFAPDNVWRSYSRAQIGPATREDIALRANTDLFPKFTWGLSGYADYGLFDPSQPVRTEFGLTLNARFEPTPGLVFSGRVRQRLTGDIDGARRSNSVLPRVRSDVALYAQGNDFTIRDLTGAYFFQPGQDVYGRVSVGLFEQMFGGFSGELLWKPVTSRLALGAELNVVRQRDFDGGFGFTDYQVATGHGSLYYDMGNGFQGQVDAGRYLAKDWGATFSLDREFNNGVRIGAFATFTNVSFDDFGEGAFDKGIRFVVPVALLSGRPTKKTISRTVRPTTRDGGARLNVNDRLYGQIRAFHGQRLQNSWGKFWR